MKNGIIWKNYAVLGRKIFPIEVISVNLSVKQFRQPNSLEASAQILAETQLNSEYLKLEITETAIMDNAEPSNRLLKQFRNRKIKLPLDDFGTGYSSLSYLHRFHLDRKLLVHLLVTLVTSAKV